MTGRLVAACLLAVWLGGPGAAAQEVGPPIRLGPPPTEPTRPSHGLTVDTLAPPEIDAVGTLQPKDRPLPLNMWQGSARVMVLQLIPRIGMTASPALHELAFRLLASPATPPPGDSPPGALLALRAERLANALGRPAAALSLLGAAPPQQGGEALGQTQVDLAFLAGDADRACTLVKTRDPSWQEMYWTQGMVTCDALQTRDAEARLGLDMLHEEKFKDNGFSSLVDLALGGQPHPVEVLPSPQSMALALLTKAGQPLPRRALDGAGLVVLRSVALGAGLPADQRAAAAEKAATLGALPPERLAEAWAALPLDAGDKDNPLNRALALGGTRGRAILWQALVAPGTAAPARVNFIATLLDKAPRADLYFPLVQALEPILMELGPDPDFRDSAAEIARALLALDKPEAAARWMEVAPLEAAQALTPLAHIVDDKAAPAWGDEDLAALERHAAKDPVMAEHRAVLAAQLLAALGTPPPEPLLLPLLDAQPALPPNAAPLVLIESEAAGKRVGGTALAVLAALGDQGATTPGIMLARAVAALRAVGLLEDAHRLAIDGAIAAGL